MSFGEALEEIGEERTGKKKRTERDLLKARREDDMTLTEQQEFILGELGRSTAWMQKQLLTERPMQYLAHRHIPLNIAIAEGLMYLPRPENEAISEVSKELFMWTGRLLAPTLCPAGIGYSGRMLGWWRPGWTRTRMLNYSSE